jgi:hypothetical protein
MPLYEAVKNTESKRQMILTNAALNADQRSAALNTIVREQQQAVQRIVTESQHGP